MFQHKKPLVVVEDNDDDFEAIQRALKKGVATDPTIVRFTEGTKAWDFLCAVAEDDTIAPEDGPAFILLDLNMPGLDGRKLLRRIKRHSVLRRIPVVVMTTSTSESDVKECYDEGANTFVSKPVDFASYEHVVRTVRDYWFNIATLCAE